MKNIIRYLAGIELLGYLYLFVHVLVYVIILWLNGIDNIKISMMFQVLVAAIVMSPLSVWIFDREKISDRNKIIGNYIIVLVINLFFAIKFSWLQILNLDVYEYVGIFTVVYILTVITYNIYLKLADESYTEYLKIYKESKRR